MKGSVLLETLSIVFLYVVLIGGAHLGVLKYWNRKFKALQTERIPYDGKTNWENTSFYKENYTTL